MYILHTAYPISYLCVNLWKHVALFRYWWVSSPKGFSRIRGVWSWPTTLAKWKLLGYTHHYRETRTPNITPKSQKFVLRHYGIRVRGVNMVISASGITTFIHSLPLTQSFWGRKLKFFRFTYYKLVGTWLQFNLLSDVKWSCISRLWR